MKRIIPSVAFCLLFAIVGLAQQSSADSPASKEDIQRYLEVMHSRDMMAKMVDAMSQPMHQMIHEQYLKDKDRLPDDFEMRANKRADEMMKTFPWDQMMDAMVPVYQKHFTKGDVDALVAFYDSPTGQKVLREMPSMMAESMQMIMPLIQKHVAEMTDRMQQEVADIVKQSDAKSGGKTQPSPN